MEFSAEFHEQIEAFVARATAEPEETIGKAWGSWLDRHGDLSRLVSEPRTPREWILPGLKRGSLGMLVGAGGVGKSFFLIPSLLAAGAGSGWPWAPGEKREPRRVLVINAEDDQDTIVDRARSVWAAGVTEGWDNVRFLSIAGQRKARAIGPRGEVGPLREALMEMCATRHFDLIVLDPLVSFSGASENDNSLVGAMIDEMRQIAVGLDVALLLVHHASQNAILNGQLDRAEAARGATALVNGVRWMGTYARPSDAERDALTAGWGSPEQVRRLRRLAVVKVNAGPDDADPVWLEVGEAGVPSVLGEREASRIERVLRDASSTTRDASRGGSNGKGEIRRLYTGEA